MTVAEYTKNCCPFYFVHTDHDKRIHKKVMDNPDDYEVVKVRFLMGKIFVEVREIGE